MPLDVSDEDSVVELIYKVDVCLQYGENLEAREDAYRQAEDYMNGVPEEDM